MATVYTPNCCNGWLPQGLEGLDFSECMEETRKEREGGDCMRVEGVGDSARTEKWLWWNGIESNMAVGSNPLGSNPWER